MNAIVKKTTSLTKFIARLRKNQRGADFSSGSNMFSRLAAMALAALGLTWAGNEVCHVSTADQAVSSTVAGGVAKTVGTTAPTAGTATSPWSNTP